MASEDYRETGSMETVYTWEEYARLMGYPDDRINNPPKYLKGKKFIFVLRDTDGEFGGEIKIV